MITWRIYLLGGVIAALFGVSMYIAHLQTEKLKAEKSAKAAEAQAIVSETTAQAVDRVTITERIIREETHNVTREIEALPSGEALVPDDVANAWATGIDELRQRSSNADGDGAGHIEELPKD